ncbi:hypothetical protein niasHT_021806 [Heterodera trifolii]|uniref:Thioredoxin domain-containing protein n=1 Tax=Heterodera trifolii TaxID=157864 RepID=A0ABD2J8P8_9BILA
MLFLVDKLRVELRGVCNIYHLLNFVLSVAFPLTKLVPPLPNLFYGQRLPGLDSREREVLIFLAVVIIWKNRKAVNSLHSLSISYLFAKLAGAALFFRSSPLLGLLYASVVLLLFVILPEPLPAESTKIRYFRADELQKTIDEDKSVIWVIEFFTTWSPDCRYVAPVFSALSEKYSLPNLRFGKLDVGKHPKEGDHFRVNGHASSKQLPTVALFRNGVQTERRPLVQQRRAVPFIFNEKNLILALGLNDVYTECKKTERTRRKNE